MISKKSQEHLKPLSLLIYFTVLIKLFKLQCLLQLLRNIQILCKNNSKAKPVCSLVKAKLYFKKSTVTFLNLPKSIPCFLSKNIHPHKSPANINKE